MTSRPRKCVELKKLEMRISESLKIPAMCLGAHEIAAFIEGDNLLTHFLDAIGFPHANGVAERPDLQEILLHSYAVMGQDAQDLRSGVYDDSILLVLHTQGALVRDQLVTQVLQLLQSQEVKAIAISRRVDSLLSRGRIQPNAGCLSLAATTRIEMENADRVYLGELEAMACQQKDMIEKECRIPWSMEDALKCSSLLARAFIQKQLWTAKEARVSLRALGLTRHIGDPEQEIRDFLRSKGLGTAIVEELIVRLMAQAEGQVLIKKLTRAALFVALEGADPISAAKAIGAARWQDVKVLLDASVAIPHLCARLYHPTKWRFSLLSDYAVSSLKSLGAKLRITKEYVNECASHLLRALKYENLAQFEEALPYSTNAYVSAFYQLRKEGAEVPPSLTDFLAVFAPACKKQQSDKSYWVRKIMAEIQPHLMRAGIEQEDVPEISAEFSRDIQEEYVHGLRDAQRKKTPLLTDHDVTALSHTRRQISQNGESWILLTWDKFMIKVGYKYPDCGWVVGPDLAADFAHPYRPLSETTLCALCHAIARTQAKPLEITARIVDRVVEVAAYRLEEWQFVEKLKAFKSELITRADLTQEDYDDWVDTETDKFLKEAEEDSQAKTK